MKKKQENQKRGCGGKKNSVQELLSIQYFTKYGLMTEHGEMVFFQIAPTNISVLSYENIERKINHLQGLISMHPDMEIVCTDSCECFDGNREYLRRRASEESNRQVRSILEQDREMLSQMQSEMSNARQFYLVMRFKNMKPDMVFSAINEARKRMSEKGFETHRLTKPELKKWVDYALANDTLILFDAAYEAFIQEDDVPHSIYEIKGAKKCAIEFRSFSKTAGFTGVRCGYTVVPKELTAATLEGERISLNKLWNRRQCTKFNGTSYITQRAAEAIYTPEGKRQIKETIGYYMNNARTMKEGLEMAGLKVYGGVNAPYIWLKTPNGVSSWKFFEQMLYEANVVGTPGVGFGPSGEGYIRLTAFGTHEDCVEAMRRIRNWLI